MPQESLADRLQYWARFTEQRQYAFAGHHPEGDMLRAVSIVLREAAARIEADAERIQNALHACRSVTHGTRIADALREVHHGEE